MTLKEGDRVRFTTGPLGAITPRGAEANEGDVGTYAGVAPHMTGYDDWHLITVLRAVEDGTEILTIPAHRSMFEPTA